MTDLETTPPDMSGESPQSVPGGTAWMLAYLTALTGVLILGAYTLFEPFGRDQGIHASIAYGWDQGLTPYRDIYNIKPPLTTLMHWIALALFGPDMQAIRLWDMIVTAVAAMGLVRVMRDLGRSPAEAGAAGLALPVIYYSMSYWEHAQTDGWAGYTVIAMLICMAAGWRREGRARLGWMIAAGALLGIGFGFKYTVAAAALIVFAPLISRGRDARFVWGDLFGGIAGGVLVIAALTGVLWLGGALPPFLEIQGFIRGYIAIGADRAPNYLREIIAILGAAPINIVITGLGLLFWLASLMRGELLFFGVVLIWGLTGFLSGHVQGQGFTYHFLPLMPVYAILWGLTFGGIWDAVAHRGIGLTPRLALGLAALVLVLLRSPIWWRGVETARLLQSNAPITEQYAQHPSTPDFDIVETQKFADLIRAKYNLDQGVFLWGYETALYLLLEQPPRHRYPYAWPFVVRFHDGRYTQDLLDRLTANPPGLIIVQDGDATPLVTGRHQSSAAFLNDFEELSDFLDQNYDPVESSPRFTLWQRR